MADHWIASRIGCAVEEIDERVTREEYANWLRYKVHIDKAPDKVDFYFCRLLAKLAAFCGGSLDPSSYLYGTPQLSAKRVPADQVADILRQEFGGK